MPRRSPLTANPKQRTIAKMIKILDFETEPILGYTVDGRVEPEDIERAFQAIEQKLSTHEKLRIYAEIHSLSGLTWSALLKDIELSARRLNWVSRFEKVAVVSDRDWLRRIAQLEDMIFRGIDIRTFSLAEQAEAQSWLRS